MRRVVNFRPLSFLAVCLILGILLGAGLTYTPLGVRIVFAVVLFLTTTAFLLFKKGKKFFVYSLLILIGMVSMVTTQFVYNQNVLNQNNVEVCGEVDSEIIVENNVAEFWLNKISVDNKNFSGRAKIFLSTSDILDFNAGDKIKLNGNISTFDFKLFDGYFAKNYFSKTKFQVLSSSVEKIQEKDAGLILRTQLKLKSFFYSETREDTAGISIALIYGDKFGINESIYNDIKISGIAHIFAVSGLHVSILAGFAIWVFKKMKMNDKVSAILTISLLFVYSLFCNFTPSITRAFIMASVFLIAKCFGKKQDSISSLSLSAIIILLINPLSIFQLGFLLSFNAVLGILMFSKSFMKKLAPKRNDFLVLQPQNKIENAKKKLYKIHTSFSELVSTSICANLFTFPISAGVFKTIPIFFLLTNILVLPFVSIIYICSLIFSFVALVFNIPSILIVFDFLFAPLKAIVMAVGQLQISSISTSSLGVFAVAYYFVLVLNSRFVFVEKRKKIIASLLVSTIFVVLSLVLAFFVDKVSIIC